MASFYVACYKGDLSDAKRELENGADINYACSNGWTALHGAAHAGHLDIVKFLVSKTIFRNPRILMQIPF